MNQAAQPLQPSPRERAVRDGEYTFYFTYLDPQPGGVTFLAESLAFIVQAGLLVQHDATMQHHGDSIINACYALFNIDTVDAMIAQKKNEAAGHINGTGGMGGAVTLFVRGARNMNKHVELRDAANQLGNLLEHIFEKREIQRAVAEVKASS